MQLGGLTCSHRFLIKVSEEPKSSLSITRFTLGGKLGYGGSPNESTDFHGLLGTLSKRAVRGGVKPAANCRTPPSAGTDQGRSIAQAAPH